MNKNILIVLFTSILVLLLTSTASAYTIEGNTVTEHFTPVSLNATPHTAHSTGWVYFGADSHTYTGDFDVCWGFNSSEALPTKAELYSPHWVNTTSNHSQTFYNVSSFTLYTGSTLDYGNTYNTNYSYTAVHEVTTYNETTMEPNGTEWITSNASFDSFVNDNGNYTITWHNRHDKWTIYKDFTGSFQTVNYNHNGFDKWYYIKNVPVVAGQAYNVRAWVEVPISLTPQTGKFYYAVKPSSETIAEAIGNNHFYALDPWWNSSWNYYKVISINQTMVNQAIGNVHYTLLVDITDTDLRDHAQADGDDIVFTDSTDSTQLDHQISSYNSTTGALVAYVNVTDISNVTSINMYYNNSGATNTEDKAGTWGTAALGVWLFDEGTGSYVNDSSGNDNNGTITGATWNASGGLDFDASGNYITTADSPEVTTFTLISTFTRNGDAGGSNSDFHQLFCGINKSINNRIMVKSDGTNSYAGVVVGGSYKNDQLTISDVNSRHTVATIWDGSYVYACLDGLKGTTPTATTGTLQSGASNIIIGRYSSSSYLTNGTIRNGFLYDYDLSSDEIATNYNNTEYPSLFISLGAEQSDSPNPLINSWQNNKTNNNSLDITINASESVNFNVTANQTITTWVWNKDTVDQIHDYNNITLSWSTGGLKHVTASATNENGTSNIITWNVTIDGGCEYYEVINSTHLEACTCNQSDVQAAIDNATDFQTVLIPAGNATWGDSASYLSVDKQITLQGNGSNTVINISNSAGSWSSGTIRISDRATVKDFTIQTNSTGNSGTVFSVNADWFRISSITYDQLTSSVNGYFLFSNKYGLVDNCNITGGSGTSELIFARGPTDSWQTLSSIGGSNNLFIEDTTFNGVGYVCDFNSNSRGVIRENDITGPMKIDAHGKCSNTPSRGVRHMEIYENTWSYNNNAVKIEFRGGTGMIFNNHREYSLGTGLQLKEYSAFQQCSSFGYVCQCPEDYPIDDQIGTGMDPKTAASEPLYIWNNTQLITNDPWNASIKDDLIPGSCAVCNYTTFAQIILNGRDYFESTTKNTSIEYESFDYPHPLASGIPGVSLLSPLTQSTTTETTVQFNVSVIDSGNLTNVTLWGNWSGGWHANETININETYNETTFTKTLTAGTYIWNAKAHDEDGNSDWANLNYTLTITENPVITLLSQYPVDLYQNTTGYFNLSYGISHSAAGLNNTSMALTYAFYDVVNANYNTSLRIPNNDRGGLCSLLQEYILRADNRNDGLNWETNITITEGNVSKWGGGDENTSRFTIVPVNSTYTKVYWNGTAQDTLWPGTWYLDRTDQTTATMTGINIDKSNHVLLQSIVPGCGIGLGGQLIDMYVDTYQGITDPVKPITIFYLNDSYDPLGSILPTDSPYAYLVTTMTATQWYVNDYTVGNSSYVNSITVNTSAISDAGITPTTKFYVYFNTEAATSKSYYMNITNSATSTNLTFGETNMLWIGDIAP
ncbi:MAG: hypothetical protein KAS32_17300, partial [Candidatus Peribacteraceae bacterium]|nr:hypothetical protein [Candidatus Peribacteraceae bacterium]